MTIAAYIRVSTHSQNLESQRAEITRWLEVHGHNLNEVRWFEDKDTGKHLSRTGFNALAEAIFSGEAKTVVVWKLDRIARSMRDGINTLSQWCECGVRVVSVTQQLDLSGTAGHLIAGVLFAVAEMELENTRERQAAGIEVAKQRGIYKGRKRGATKAKPARAKELQAKGLKQSEIAQALGVSERTVGRYLS
jgi:DNA invertase Pin-like site-specific DNA recombinase